MPVPPEVVADPEDLGPQREDTTRAVHEDEEVENVLDEDEDDEDDEDAPPAPREAPEGFQIVNEPPSLAALTPKNSAQQMLVGCSILYRWSSVGWCVGVINKANGDRRYKMDGEVINFYVHYEIDDDTSAHVLTLDAYGGEGTGSWVLLKELA